MTRMSKFEDASANLNNINVSHIHNHIILDDTPINNDSNNTGNNDIIWDDTLSNHSNDSNESINYSVETNHSNISAPNHHQTNVSNTHLSTQTQHNNTLSTPTVPVNPVTPIQTFNNNNNNNNNSNIFAKHPSMPNRSAFHTQRHSILSRRNRHNFQKIQQQNAYKTEAASRYVGLNTNSSVKDVEYTLGMIDKELKFVSDQSTYNELIRLKKDYTDLKELLINKQQKKNSEKKSNDPMSYTPNNSNINSDGTLKIRGNTLDYKMEAFIWQIDRSNHGSSDWINMDPHYTKEIEYHYQSQYINYQYQYKGRTKMIEFNCVGDLKKQRDLLTDNIKYVRRRITPQVLTLPITKKWTAKWHNKRNVSLLHKLNRHMDATEYNAVLQLLKNRGLSGGYEIISIDRVQNHQLLQKYNSYDLSRNIAELYLFHGSTNDLIEPIINQGLDFRLHGKNNTIYGNGSYFALNASYSVQFCKLNLDKSLNKCVKKLILFRVKIGEYCVGFEGLRRPPLKNTNNKNGILYDSVVNNIDYPTIYVTFENNQCYPCYVISFAECVQ